MFLSTIPVRQLIGITITSTNRLTTHRDAHLRCKLADAGNSEVPLELSDGTYCCLCHLCYAVSSGLTICLFARIETIKLALGNDSLTDNSFVFAVEDGSSTMCPVVKESRGQELWYKGWGEPGFL